MQVPYKTCLWNSRKIKFTVFSSPLYMHSFLDFFLWNHPNQPAEVKLLASYVVKENPQSRQFLLNGTICDPPQDFDANTCKGAVVFKFIGKSNERILCKLSKSEILRSYSMVHVAMETTKMSNFTFQSKSFVSIFFTRLVSACELQPLSCHDLANDIYLQTPKTVQPP